MSIRVARLAKLKRGVFSIAGKLNERLPVITNGLVTHFPFDGKGGMVDIVNGVTPVQTAASEVNILDCLMNSWKDPANWSVPCVWDETEQALKFTAGGTALLSTFIPVDAAKHWYIEAAIKNVSGGNGVLYFGNISYDVNKAMLPGHPGSYDYFGASGKTPTTSWTVYNNSEIGGKYGAGRTGETSGNEYSTFHTGVKYVKIMLLPNYSGTVNGLMVKDLKFYYKDTDNSRITSNGDSISIEEATTNVVTNTNLDTGWDGRGYYVKDHIFNEIAPPIGINSPTVGFTWTGVANGYWYSYGDYAPQVPSTTYTVSLYVKTLDHNFRICFYTADNTEVGRYQSGYILVPNDGEWHRVVWPSFLNIAGSTSSSLSFNFSYGNVANSPLTRTWLCAPQMEAKPFATSFVVGSRSIGNLSIKSSTYWDNDFSLFAYVKTSTTAGWRMLGGAWLKWYFAWYSDSANVLRFSYMDTTQKSIEATVPSGSCLNWNYIGFTYNKTSQTLKIYCNGVLLTTNTSVVLSGIASVDTAIGALQGDNFAYILNAEIKNYSIYNRDLTQTEVTKLYNQTFKLKDYGDLVTNEIIEKPLALPTTAVHFPLNCNMRDTKQNYNRVMWKDLVGVEVADNIITKTAATLTWDSGCVSTEEVYGDCFVSFKAGDLGSDKMLGLASVTSGNTNAIYSDIDFAIYFTGANNIQIYEQGGLRGDYGAFTLNDIFTIRCDNSIVRYYKNGTQLYVSALTPIFPLCIDTSFHKQNSSISNINFQSSTPSLNFKEKSLYVGKAVTNLYKQALTSTDFAVNGNGTVWSVFKFGDNHYEYEYQYNQNLVSSYKGQTCALTIGLQYTATMDVYISSDANILSTGTTWVADIEGGLGWGFYYDNTKKGQWQRLKTTPITATTTSANLYMYPTTGTIYATTGVVRYKNIIVTQHTYGLPFFNKIQAISKPQLPVSLLSFSEGTISLWFKPTAGFFNQSSWNRVIGHSTSTNYNEIEIMRSNTSNSLCLAISNNAGTPQTAWASCLSSPLVADTWYHVVARWSISAGTMSLTVNNVKVEQPWTATYQPTVVGTLDIGYHNFTDRHSESYITNLIISKVSISDAEVDKLYRSEMSTKRDQLQVVDQIIEGQVL